MPNILPVSDLRNYNEVLKNCQVGEPVFLTKNGRGRFVVMDIEDYERDKAEKKLLEKLQEAEAAVKDGKGWLSLDELKTMVGEQSMMKLRINPLVAKDLKSIKDFIAEDNVDKALEMVQEIYCQFENIQQFPYIGADLSKRVSFKTDYKYVVWEDYVVLYKVGKESVEIMRGIRQVGEQNGIRGFYLFKLYYEDDIMVIIEIVGKEYHMTANLGNELYIQMKPNKLYPLVTIASIDPETLKKTVESLADNKDTQAIKAINYNGKMFILEGNYELLAANILNKESVDVEIIDRNNIPFWNIDENLEDTLQAVGISTLYDFEAIGGFTYDEYPAEYMR